MCGIVGIASHHPIDQCALDAAVDCLRHRGPDGNGIYVGHAGRVGLGHTRLAIIDLTPGGHQPMHSQDGQVVLTFNGEIYNYLELRAELADRGYRFKSLSDTEVLLAGFLLDGPKILERLNGIFAFAIYDCRSNELFLARDQMGIKPLYYAETPDGFVFASEIKALLKLVPLDRSLDLSAMRRYLTFLWCPGEQTPMKHVKKLSPGSALTVRDDGTVVQRWTYWEPPQYAPRQGWNPSDCAVELNELLGQCVRRQMISDAPLGAFLSGGIDSSSIIAAARRQNPDIQCFTVDLAGGAEQGTANDLPYARAVAADLGVSLSEVRVDAAAMCDRVVDMVEILDEPLADPACLNVLFISELARSHGIKVLLSGAGGDDLFTGYRRHTLLSFDPLWSVLPVGVRRRLATLAANRDCRGGFNRRLARLLAVVSENGDRRITANFMWGAAGSVDNLLAPEVRAALADDDVEAPLAKMIADAPSLPTIEKCLKLEKRFFLADHNLIYTDKMAMAAGVEVRVPFLDLDLLEFAATVPSIWKHRFMRPKWILKESQRPVLPANVIDRPKTGFGAPLRRWMKGEMQNLVEDLLSPAVISRRGLFDGAAVQEMLAKDRRGETDASYTLFSLMCIELWCRRFVDAPPPPVARAETMRSRI
ncbi:asparagine synthase (glutamine-hydrolysing) [Rhizobiales bacterium GAS188]|nr:asparagine synthase (glutamine-hydrolysing) [Rhizobiales bacterium GAS188]